MDVHATSFPIVYLITVPSHIVLCNVICIDIHRTSCHGQSAYARNCSKFKVLSPFLPPLSLLNAQFVPFGLNNPTWRIYVQRGNTLAAMQWLFCTKQNNVPEEYHKGRIFPLYGFSAQHRLMFLKNTMKGKFFHFIRSFTCWEGSNFVNRVLKIWLQITSLCWSFTAENALF